MHFYGNFEIVEMLVQKSTEFNINLNAEGYGKRTAFHYAVEKRELKSAEMLVQ